MHEPERDSHPLSAVDDDVLCRRCGYMLRGLNPCGACPECGLAIARSVGPERLDDLDPEWLRAVRRGLRWVVAGLLLLVISSLVAIGAVVNYQFSDANHLAAVVLASLGVLLAGSYLCCPPGAATDHVAEIRSKRRRLRFTTLLLGATTVVSYGLFQSGALRSPLANLILIVILIEAAATSHAYARWLRLLFNRRGRPDSRDPWIAPEVAPIACVFPLSVLAYGPMFLAASAFGAFLGYVFVFYATRRVIHLLTRAIGDAKAR